MFEPEKVLRKYWGYEGFRPGQREVICSALQNHDTLALMPTGGGKSITFQVPALVLPGICLVISPLVALMKDQVRQLRQKSIRATLISSEMSHDEIIKELENCILGDYKFLYISPERISSDIFQKKLAHLKQKVNLLVVDEAHCISQWGNDFRPDYRFIADIRDAVDTVPVIAVTASATPTVATDICEQLHFRKGYNVVKTAFVRPNLSYVVRKTDDKLKEICHILSSVPGSAIIYCRTRVAVEKYASELKRAGVDVDFFHAGLEPQVKTERQQAWQRGRLRVLVATNAFGMGIDKGDVRLVIHTDFPDSLEAYYQESGRAGRDGKRAYAVALLGPRDLTAIRQRPGMAFPTLEYIQKVYTSLCNLFQIAEGDGLGAVRYLNESEFIQNWKLDLRRVRTSLQILSLSKCIKYEPYPNTQPYLRCIVGREALNEFLRSESPASLLAEQLLRSYSGVFSDGCYVNVEHLAKACELDPQVAEKALPYLRNVGFFYAPAKKEPRITFLQARQPVERLHISSAAYSDRKALLEHRLEAVIQYLESPGCRQSFLSNYFGSESAPCGHCDNCLAARKLNRAG